MLVIHRYQRVQYIVGSLFRLVCHRQPYHVGLLVHLRCGQPPFVALYRAQLRMFCHHYLLARLSELRRFAHFHSSERRLEYRAVLHRSASFALQRLVFQFKVSHRDAAVTSHDHLHLRHIFCLQIHELHLYWQFFTIHHFVVEQPLALILYVQVHPVHHLCHKVVRQECLYLVRCRHISKRAERTELIDVSHHAPRTLRVRVYQHLHSPLVHRHRRQIHEHSHHKRHEYRRRKPVPLAQEYVYQRFEIYAGVLAFLYLLFFHFLQFSNSLSVSLCPARAIYLYLNPMLSIDAISEAILTQNEALSTVFPFTVEVLAFFAVGAAYITSFWLR